jgi:hypothetical protein
MKKFPLLLMAFACSMTVASAQFQRSYGKYVVNTGYSVQTTRANPGYVIAGYLSDSAFEAGSLLKTDLNGNPQWTMQYGGPAAEALNSVREIRKPLIDGRYAATGGTASFGYGWMDVLFTLTNDNGIPLHSWAYGGNDWDMGNCIQLVDDDVFGPGYIIAGETRSFPEILPGNNVYVIRTDLTGQPLRSAIYGYEGDQRGLWIEQTRDKGYIITGTSTYTCESGVDSLGSKDIYVLRLGSDLSLLWDRVIGGGEGNLNDDEGACVKENTDGSFLITGHTHSFGLIQNYEAFLLNLAADGSFGWMKTYGLQGLEFGTSLAIGPDNSGNTQFDVLGQTTSTEDGNYDAFMFSTDGGGNLLSARRYSMGAEASYELTRGYKNIGYVFTGCTSGGNGRSIDVYLVETDPNGSTNSLCESKFRIKEISQTPCLASNTLYSTVQSGSPINLPFEQIEFQQDQCASASSQESDSGNLNKFSIHPNPSAHQVAYESNGKSGEIQISDMNGEVKIRVKFVPGQNLIDVSALTKGMYIAEIINEDGSAQRERLVKE